MTCCMLPAWDGSTVKIHTAACQHAKCCSLICSIKHGDLPGLALSAESQLGITAGLQDRVIQVSFLACV